jgi:hypothetical protein
VAAIWASTYGNTPYYLKYRTSRGLREALFEVVDGRRSAALTSAAESAAA